MKSLCTVSPAWSKGRVTTAQKIEPPVWTTCIFLGNCMHFSHCAVPRVSLQEQGTLVYLSLWCHNKGTVQREALLLILLCLMRRIQSYRAALTLVYITTESCIEKCSRKRQYPQGPCYVYLFPRNYDICGEPSRQPLHTCEWQYFTKILVKIAGVLVSSSTPP